MSLSALQAAVQGLENQRLQRQEQERPVAAQPVADPFAAPVRLTALSRETAQPVEVEPEELQLGLKDGRYALDPTQSYQVVDDKGQAQQVAGRELHRALDRGWSLDSQLQADGRREAARIGAIEQDESASPLRTFGRTLANEALLGIPEHLMSPEDKERFAIGQRVNPTASGLAQAAGYGIDAALIAGTGGTAAALKAGGRLAAKAAPKLAGRIAAGAARNELLPSLVKGAARGAVESAAIDVPRAVSEAALGDPEEAAESLSLSVGLGTIVGGLLGAGGAVAQRAGRAALGKAAGVPVQSSEDVGKAMGAASDKQAVQLAGGDRVSKALGLTRQEHAQFLRDEGLLRKVGEADADYVSRLQQHAQTRQAASRAPFVELDSTAPRTTLPRPEDVLKGTQGRTKDLLDEVVQSVPLNQKAVVQGSKLVNDQRLSLASLAEAQDDLVLQSKALKEGAEKKAMQSAIDRLDEVFERVDPTAAASRKAALQATDRAAQSAEALERMVKDGSNRTLVGDVFDLVGRSKGLAKIGIAGAIDPSLMLPAAAKQLFERAGGVQAFQVALAARGANVNGLSQEALKELARQVYGGSALMSLADASITHGRRLLTDGLRGSTRQALGAASAAGSSLLFQGERSRDVRRRSLEQGQRIIDAAEALDAGAPLSSSELFKDEAPALAQAHQQHVKRSLRWLADRAPRKQSDVIDGDVLPSKREARSFELRMQAAFDPDAAAKGIRQGRIHPEQVEALKALYPRQWQRLQQELATMQHTTRRQRLGASVALESQRPAWRQRKQRVAELMAQSTPQQPEPQQQRPMKVPGAPTRTSAELSPADRTSMRGQLG